MMRCMVTAPLDGLGGPLRMVEVCLAALYLAGGPRPGPVGRRNWPNVASLLRREAPTLGAAAASLRRHGWWAEAILLETPGLLAWAEAQTAAGLVLSAASPSYPSRWLSLLGSSAPPALWVRGPLPEAPFLAIVGSRHLTPSESRFARAVGKEAVRLGYAVVSGGAAGADRAAVSGAAAEAATAGVGGRVLEILPYGLDAASGEGAALSNCAPGEGFSGPRAMERNTLVHTLAEVSAVVSARFREGGTWHGAVGALRRRRRLIVRQGPGSSASCEAAMRALVALGARPLVEASGLAVALAPSDDCLLREHRAAYGAAAA